MKADILRGVSIGFNPVRTEPMDPKRPYGPQRHLEWEPIEVSLVAVPADPDARVLAKARAHASLAPENLPDRDEMGKRLNEVMARRTAASGLTIRRPLSDTERRAWRVAELQRQHTDHLLNQPRYRHLWRAPFEERLRYIRAKSK